MILNNHSDVSMTKSHTGGHAPVYHNYGAFTFARNVQNIDQQNTTPTNAGLNADSEFPGICAISTLCIANFVDRCVSSVRVCFHNKSVLME